MSRFEISRGSYLDVIEDKKTGESFKFAVLSDTGYECSKLSGETVKVWNIRPSDEDIFEEIIKYY